MFKQLIALLAAFGAAHVIAPGVVGLSTVTLANAATGSEVAAQAQGLPTCHGPWWHKGRGWSLKKICRPGYIFCAWRWVCNPRG